jgi:hypothetical protein
VAATSSRRTCSKTDGNHTDEPVIDEGKPPPTPQVILVTIPETRPNWMKPRQMLEAALLLILTILGAHALLQVLV